MTEIEDAETDYDLSITVSTGSYYTLQNGRSLHIATRTRDRVILNDTSNRLFIDDIWPGAKATADFFNLNSMFCNNKTILELGAGAALPSLVASALGARLTVISDFPEISVLDHIATLLERNKLSNCKVLGHKWGEDMDKLLHISEETSNGYDLIILAELLWKDTYSEHFRLLTSVAHCLSRESGIAVVAFTHRATAEHTEDKDMEFFDTAKRHFGLKCTWISTSSDYYDVFSDEKAAVNIYFMHFSDNLKVNTLHIK
jgi:predicted nicotinamide N-methyase